MATVKQDDLIGKSLTAFILDVGNQYHLKSKDISKDTEYALRRLRNEGMSFVTKTLPKIGNHFDSCLKKGLYTPHSFLKRNKDGVLPLFLRGLTCMVFNDDGTIRDNPCTAAIRLFRQLCYLFYKVEGDYPTELVNAKINDFVAVDGSLSYSRVNPETAGCVYHAQELIGRLFEGFDPELIEPRPGPGQSADKVPHWSRYEPRVHYKTVHEAYPYYRYFYNGTRHLLDRVGAYRRLIRRDTPISRLDVVPKDSRGPRIICMEPTEVMWLQQGLGRAMMAHLEEHPLTRGHVNFNDQSINGKLALDSSVTGRFATLDMKEASDRISRDLVEILFEDVPKLRDKLLALSSREIKLPSGDVIPTRKYAPMGSALCFPVMSVVHWALMVGTIMCQPGVKTKQAAAACYVYGDDLIVKREYTQMIFEQLPSFGLRFNEDKSCFEGHFRESCGVDAFKGDDVTPVKIKTLTFGSRSPEKLATHLAYFHSFFNRGLWNLARLWQTRIESVWGKLPRCTADSGILGYIVPREHIRAANIGRWRWNRNLQCIELKARFLVTRPFASALGGWEQLVRFLLHSKEESTPYYLRNRAKFARRWFAITSV